MGQDNDIFSMMPLPNQKQTEIILACNTYTKKFGVSLTDQEVKELVACRKETLKEQQRLEFGEGILPKLIYAFCDSPFIYQDNYVETLTALQEIFYLYKNESMDEWSDDELIAYMKKYFNGKCKGSLEYLEETVLEGLSRDMRAGIREDIDDDDFL